MKNYTTNVLGNPAPFLIGAFLGFYIADRNKESNLSKKILFTASGGLILSVLYISLLDKGKLGTSIEINPGLPPVQGVKQ